MTSKTIRTARPNGFPVRLVQHEQGDHIAWTVEEYFYEGEGYGYWDDCPPDFATLAAATAAFEATCAELSGTRNWRAQAEYDEAHGTDNGYDPRIEAWKREY